MPSPLTRLVRALAFGAAWLPAAVLAQTAPAISTQPAGRVVNAGTSITLSVTATGTAPLSYQWNLAGAPITGATSATYTFSPTPQQAGPYSVTVSNASGAVTSNNVAVTVYTPYIVRTLAGQVGVTGFADGTGTAALFSHPMGIAVDTAGNVYMADTSNCVIRMITPAGVVTTLAGQVGIPGSAAGAGTAAQFNYPFGVAVDSAGYVYVADTFNNTIRKIAPGGSVTTLAGTAPTAQNPSSTGSTNGTGAAARFNAPRGVAVDGNGVVYVADTANNLIRKITPAGAVTTIAGAVTNGAVTDGTTTAARFDYPFGIASDSAGNLWVADTSGQVIRAITPAGVVTTYAGLANNAGSNGGTGNAARFNTPMSLAVDSQGDVFVADQNNDTIREILPGGVVVTLAGNAGTAASAEGAGTMARFFNPFGIAVDRNGNVYVADTQNSTLRVAGTQPLGDVAPVILTQPGSVTVQAGATATFSVNASATPSPTYQWQKNGVNIAGATGITYSLANVQTSDGASYAVVVSNQDGSVTSNTVTLTVLTRPAFTGSSQSQTAAAGDSIVLNANATGGNLTYQWYLGGNPVPGATGASLQLSPVGTYMTGTYTVTATNSLGSATNTIGTIAVTTDARLMNLSALGQSSPGASNALVVGFVLSGGSKNVLLRGAGPTLANFGVASPLANPQLRLYAGQTLIASDLSGWGGSPILSGIFSQVFAFAFPNGSLDSALYEPNLAPAASNAQYSVQIQDQASNGSGAALAELYDADTGAPAAHLINLSARGFVPANGSLTGGFIVGGTQSETVLIRAIGPTLAGYGVANPLSRPVLTLYRANNDGTGASTTVATNSGWGNSAVLNALFTKVYAFPLPNNSNDAALAQVLAPGSYTATVTGLSGTAGVALVEIYEVPAQ